MKILFFNYWNTSRELEWNLQVGCFSFRVGTHQLALWVHPCAVFDFKLQERISVR